jgi:DNA recombination protein RmuC
VATPNNFVALMKTIAFGWRQQSVTENAEHIRRLGEELHARLATFFEHLLRTGKHLNTAIENFNRSVGSLERQVIPGARRFEELGIQSKKPLQPPVQLATAARKTQEPAASDDEAQLGKDSAG